MPRLSHEHTVLRFTAPVSDVVTKKVYVVSHDGTEAEFKLLTCDTVEQKENGVAVRRTTQCFLKEDVTKGDATKDNITKDNITVETMDETKSRVTVTLAVRQTDRALGFCNEDSAGKAEHDGFCDEP